MGVLLPEQPATGGISTGGDDGRRAGPAGREIDLGALGGRGPRPKGNDTTPEVPRSGGDALWAARGLLYVVGGFVLVALIWAHFSVLDVLVQARGRLVPEGYVRPVQAAVGALSATCW